VPWGAQRPAARGKTGAPPDRGQVIGESPPTGWRGGTGPCAEQPGRRVRGAGGAPATPRGVPGRVGPMGASGCPSASTIILDRSVNYLTANGCARGGACGAIAFHASGGTVSRWRRVHPLALRAVPLHPVEGDLKPSPQGGEGWEGRRRAALLAPSAPSPSTCVECDSHACGAGAIAASRLRAIRVGRASRPPAPPASSDRAPCTGAVYQSPCTGRRPPSASGRAPHGRRFTPGAGRAWRAAA
jgi:hypothetical protein